MVSSSIPLLPCSYYSLGVLHAMVDLMLVRVLLVLGEGWLTYLCTTNCSAIIYVYGYWSRIKFLRICVLVQYMIMLCISNDVTWLISYWSWFSVVDTSALIMPDSQLLSGGYCCCYADVMIIGLGDAILEFVHCLSSYSSISYCGLCF